jgi:hypothetical protein
VLISVQKDTIIKLPTIGLANPPPSVPGAGVFAKNKAGLIAENPLYNRIDKIQNKNNIPIAIASIEKVKPIALDLLRLLNKDASRDIMFLLPDFSPYAST